MNHDEYLNYTSEINMLEALLAEIPVDNVIERISLEDRLTAARTAIADVTESKLNSQSSTDLSWSTRLRKSWNRG